jgi:CotS family spore coat protein
MAVIEYEEKSKEEEIKILTGYRLAPEIFEKYGLKIIDIVPKRSIYRVETDQGLKCLKKVRYDQNTFRYIDEAMEHLVHNGFSKIASLVKTLDGSLYVEDEEDKYVVMNWLEGRECDYENPIELNLAVKTLAELHSASKGFEPSIDQPERNDLGKWPDIFQNRSQELVWMKENVEQKENQNIFDKMFLENIEYYYQNSLEAIESFKFFSYKKLVEKAQIEKSFCHNDYAYHNILISYDGQQIMLLDFDYCVIDIRIKDIASLIHRNLKKCFWDIGRAEYILNSYHSEKALSNDELKGIYTYLLFPTDFWRIANQYYIEKKDWNKETFVNKLIQKSEYKELRQGFLKEFKKMTGI